MTTVDSECRIVEIAQAAISQLRWSIGESAAKWMRKYAKGRTDVEFGDLIGISGEQVFQCRLVWDRFSDVKDVYRNLLWSHFYAALGWDDAPECFDWADDNRATVAEMKAWRRALRGESPR